jgi:hypothetical protein
MLRKVIGLLLIIAAVAGIIFSVYGLIQVWRIRPAVTQTVTDNLALFDQTLNTTHDGLAIVGQVVQTTTVEVASLQTTTLALAQAIHDTTPMVDSLTSLTGHDLPEAITATKTSLASASSSAQLIDNVLTALTSIPFSPVAGYKPDVPLHTALAQVSASLDTLTPSLATINNSVASGKANLGVVETELNNVSETTRGISDTLGGALVVINQYQGVVAQLKLNVEATQLVAPGWITTITWVLTFVLVWLFVAQLGLGAQGLEMLRGRSEAK